MKQKSQIVFIHGGETFKGRKDYISFLKNREVSLKKKKKWSREYLDKKLGRYFDIIRPEMPLKEDAKYEDWKIHFEKILPLLSDQIILIGSSLGGIFLVKYLSENEFPKKLISVYLIAPPFENSLPEEDLGDFELGNDLSRINNRNIYLFFSRDDPVVPVLHAEKYKKKLPNANILILEGKNGHFKIPKFPELIKMIKENVRKI